MYESDTDSPHLLRIESLLVEVDIQHVDPSVSTLFRRMRDEDQGYPQILHNKLYSSKYFKMLLVLLSLIADGSVVGFFSEIIEAYIGQTERSGRKWWTIDWGTWPDVVATMSALGVVLILAVISPFFSKKLAS